VTKLSQNQKETCLVVWYNCNGDADFQVFDMADRGYAIGTVNQWVYNGIEDVHITKIELDMSLVNIDDWSNAVWIAIEEVQNKNRPKNDDSYKLSRAYDNVCNEVIRLMSKATWKFHVDFAITLKLEAFLRANMSEAIVHVYGGYLWKSGGGCNAFRFDKDSEVIKRGNLPYYVDGKIATRTAYVLISTEDAEAPQYPYQRWLVGYYTEDDECIMQSLREDHIADVIREFVD
jgi:hypothetical protein